MQSHYAHKLLKHGVAAMLVGLFSGFLLIFSMIGGMSLSPIPVLIPFELPGTTEGWRIIHLGMLLNGMMAILLSVAMRALYMPDKKAFWVSVGITIAIWGNFMFYVFGMFAPNHGVTLEANRLGEASIAGALAFVPAVIGAVTSIYALILMLLSEPAEDS